MRKIAIAVLMLAVAGGAQAKGTGHGGGHSGGHAASHSRSTTSPSVHWTAGYTRKDGTYVQGHNSTNPNSTRNDNFSTRGNTNPYTGAAGTKPRDEDPK